ncbi:hypothetical protein AAFF_G00316390 [Aldrovandia affinis]|uniref:Uncharacterized protein n=1 Tax=Aldrovandia affinis TaxID=143900 RepID=A0AAD7WRG8_9TELE|nr:hypothetical protein AAFF_G00316390 [Aldrovandia affinis]
MRKAEHQTPKLPCEGAFPEGVGHRFRGPTPPGAQRARRTAVSVQDLLHRQTPQSTSTVEVAHRCQRTTSTHPAPPDSNGHPRGRHHLATGQPRVQIQILHTQDRERTLTDSSRRSTDLTTTTFPISDSHRRDHTPSLLRTRARRASRASVGPEPDTQDFQSALAHSKPSRVAYGLCPSATK